MKLLSIDPSSSAPGFAFFVDDFPQQCATYKITGDSLLIRMKKIILIFQELIKFEPDYIAMESPYLGISKSTSMKMGQIYGIMCGSILMNNFPCDKIIEIHPMTAKKAAGLTHFKNREEGKKNLLQLMTAKYPHLKIADDNSSDAIAVGLAALNIINAEAIVKEHNERQSHEIS